MSDVREHSNHTTGSPVPAKATTRRPSLTVITPSFQQGSFIRRTIESVLSQGVPGLQYLVFDAGSTDDTAGILREYASALTATIEPDAGQADAINKGLRRATGDIIGWLNSDDVYYAGACTRILDVFAAHPDVDVVYGEADHIDADDRVIEPYGVEPFDYARLKDVCFFCQPAVFFRRRVVDRHGLLEAKLRYCMDYEYWLRILAERPPYLLRAKLAGSRLHTATKTLASAEAFHREILEMLSAKFGTPPTRWVYNLAHVIARERGLTRETPEKDRAFVAAVIDFSERAFIQYAGGVPESEVQTLAAWREYANGPSSPSRIDSTARREGESRSMNPFHATRFSLQGQSAVRDPVSLSPAALFQVSRTPALRQWVLATLKQLTPDNYLQLLIEDLEPGGAPPDYTDLPHTLAAAAQVLRPTTYLEIGVRRGRSLVVAALSAPHANLWGLDLWIENYAGLENPGAEFVRDELRRLGHRGQLTLVAGDSRETLPALFASSPDLYFDLVTVDGDHTAEGAVRDLVTVLPRITPGGVLLFDDICHPKHRYLADCWEGTVGAHPDFETASYSASGDGIAIAIRKQVGDVSNRVDRLDAVRRMETILSGERQQTIERLTALLQESDADRAARLKAMEQLTLWLTDSEADKAAAADIIADLQKRLKDAEARLSQATDTARAPRTS